MIRRGSAKQKHDARRAWLLAHPALWQHAPGLNEDVTAAGRVHLDALRDQMLTLGLLGSHTPDNQRETIRRLVSELRGQSVGQGW